MNDRFSRRAMFGQFFKKAAEVTAKTVVERVEQKLPPRRRPPGALVESLFLASCTRCNACAEACPHYAIHLVQGGLDNQTPVMVPEKVACHLCDDFPCIAACKDGALEARPGQVWRFGTVSVLTDRCIAFMGPECGACSNLCPPHAPALTMVRNRPLINSQTCIGCGLCIEACPTIPAAIQLQPLTSHKEVGWKINEMEPMDHSLIDT